MTLRVDDLSITYHDVPVVEGVTFAVSRGIILGLKGVSGSGKTTILRALAGQLPPTALVTGRYSLDGRVFVDSSEGVAMTEPIPRVALIEQNSVLATDPHMTLRRMIAQPLRARRLDHPQQEVLVKQACERTGVGEELLGRLPHEVSGGQLQRACVARLLVAQPRYVLADEPTAHLDPISTATVAGVLHALAEHGCGVIIASHDDALLEALAGG
ncbi:MAG: ATP-binding cassette domain-containing protein [Actinomycetaceae bacterium]|nr:ATP-binding cassette domain-containing protein [Actinomycetaceae bacterium]